MYQLAEIAQTLANLEREKKQKQGIGAPPPIPTRPARFGETSSNGSSNLSSPRENISSPTQESYEEEIGSFESSQSLSKLPSSSSQEDLTSSNEFLQASNDFPGEKYEEQESEEIERKRSTIVLNRPLDQNQRIQENDFYLSRTTNSEIPQSPPEQKSNEDKFNFKKHIQRTKAMTSSALQSTKAAFQKTKEELEKKKDEFNKKREEKKEQRERERVEYADYNRRLASFSESSTFKWIHVNPSPQDCAAAGFFFYPKASHEDRTKFFLFYNVKDFIFF